MNDRHTCIAIDDEPLALLVIEQFCQRFGHLDLPDTDSKRSSPNVRSWFFSTSR